MGHLGGKKELVYLSLAERLNRYPVGAHVDENLMAILKRLYTESEAELGSIFPILPMPLDKLAMITGLGRAELSRHLENMAAKGLVVDFQKSGATYYALSPMVVGFFEYAFMRVNSEIDLAEMARLFEDYFAAEAAREEIFGAPTKIFKTLPYEAPLERYIESEVMDYERASAVIRRSGGGALSVCCCRHKAALLDKACGAPVEGICASLGSAAEWLVRRGFARKVSVDELLRNLDISEKHGLVHIGDNVMNKPAFICSCCGCCCEILRTINRTSISSVHPSNFMPHLQGELCPGCGICVDKCHVHAIGMEEELPVIDEERCLGCGVCAAACPGEALVMLRRRATHTPPQNKREQLTAIALEKGRI